MPQKVMVSGCFDLLHSGHVEFIRRAAEFGDLYVSIGSDRTIAELKGHAPALNERQRLFVVRALRGVKEARIGAGGGVLDFLPELLDIRPDVFIVNHDGDRPEKEGLCKRLGIRYIVLERMPPDGVEGVSSTDLRDAADIPARLDLAGGWLDQPFVSKHHSGPVIVASICPDPAFGALGGMADSTRRAARDIWGHRLPPEDPEKLARILFGYENVPSERRYVSGSQDALGVCLPGISKLYYEGGYWPERIDRIVRPETCRWLSGLLRLVPLGYRAPDFDVLSDQRIDAEKAERLALAAFACWNAIIAGNPVELGCAVRAGFEAQAAMFPLMRSGPVEEAVAEYGPRTLGYKVTGAGGGGYLMLVTEEAIGLPASIRLD